MATAADLTASTDALTAAVSAAAASVTAAIDRLKSSGGVNPADLDPVKAAIDSATSAVGGIKSAADNA